MPRIIANFNAYIYLLRPGVNYRNIVTVKETQTGKIMTSDILIAGKVTWVVVADEACATVYSGKFRSGPLTDLFSMQNDVARLKTADLISDRGGRSFDSHGQGRHMLSREKSSPQDHAANAFAKDLAQRIYNAVLEGACNELVLIAAPRFLGELRAALKKTGKVVPCFTINKEMVGRDVGDIEKLLAEI
jgi:protein required for attachment to host cells